MVCTLCHCLRCMYQSTRTARRALPYLNPMPPPSDHPAFNLSLRSRPYKVVQRKRVDEKTSEYLAALYSEIGRSEFVSVTHTDEETSIVYEAADDDKDASWRCIKIQGPMDFGW